MEEKKKYLEGTLKILKDSEKEKSKYNFEVLGREFIIYPNVFSPKYFKDTEFFAKEIPVNRGDEVLEIGCGTGIVSIFASLKGANKVVAIDINPSAVKNAKENIELHNLSDKIEVREGSVYSPLKKGEKFDLIFWNTPFAYSETIKPTVLEKAVIDVDYKFTKEFISKAKIYLKDNGRLIIGFSTTLGHFDELEKILEKEGYNVKILKSVDSEEVHPVKFEIIEALPKN